jgi:hypothetical protein
LQILEHLTLTVIMALAVAAKGYHDAVLSALRLVTRVDASDTGLNLAALQRINFSRHTLRHLIVRSCQSFGPECLSYFSGFPHLRRLNVDNCTLLADQHLVHFVSQCSALEDLSAFYRYQVWSAHEWRAHLASLRATRQRADSITIEVSAPTPS